MEIETDFQAIQAGNYALRADKLPISHNNMVGENSFPTQILETGVLPLVVQNRLCLDGDEF